MKEIRPVTVRKNAFGFCKYSMALLLWLGLGLQNIILVIVVFGLLLMSAILKVEKAPLVLIYSLSIERLRPSNDIMVDQNAVYFAHLVGCIIAGVAVFLNLLGYGFLAWIVVGVLAILKTSGAFGKCGAMKLYACMNNPNGTCCRFGSKLKEGC